jgi:hypothetical protein
VWKVKRRIVAAALAAASQMLSVGAAFAGGLLQIEGHLLRWEDDSPAKRTIITYSILATNYSVPGNKSILSPSNCAGMHAFSGIFKQSPGLSDEVGRRELRGALEAWEGVANITFVEVSDPLSADILIGAQDRPQGKAFANLSYRSGKGAIPVVKALGRAGPDSSIAQDNAGGTKGVTPIDQAYVCLNPETRWKVGFDGNLDVYDLRYTFTHEIGHAIGLDHPDNFSALMSYRYDERVQSLQPSDIAMVQRLYGAPAQEKSSVSAALSPRSATPVAVDALSIAGAH